MLETTDKIVEWAEEKFVRLHLQYCRSASEFQLATRKIENTIMIHETGKNSYFLL